MQIMSIQNYNSNTNFKAMKGKKGLFTGCISSLGLAYAANNENNQKEKSYKMFPRMFSQYVSKVADMFPNPHHYTRSHSFIESKTSEEIRQTFVANGALNMIPLYWLQPDGKGRTQFLHDLEANNENIAPTLLSAINLSRSNNAITFEYVDQMLLDIYKFLHNSPDKVKNNKFYEDLLTIAQTLRQKVISMNVYNYSFANEYLAKNRVELERINKNSDAKIIKELFSNIPNIPTLQEEFINYCPYNQSNVNSTKAIEAPFIHRQYLGNKNTTNVNSIEVSETPFTCPRRNTIDRIVRQIQDLYDKEGIFSLEQIRDIVNFPDFNNIANMKYNVVGEEIGHLIVDAPIESEDKATLLLTEIFHRLRDIRYSFDAKDNFGTTPLDKAITSENKLVEGFIREYLNINFYPLNFDV